MLLLSANVTIGCDLAVGRDVAAKAERNASNTTMGATGESSFVGAGIGANHAIPFVSCYDYIIA